MARKTALKIIDELRNHLPPLKGDSFDRLRESCKKYGIIDKLTGWKEKKALVDGFNRHAISKLENLEYEVNWISFKDIEAVKNWMDENQLGKRNLTQTARKIVDARSSKDKDKHQLSLFNSYEKIMEVLPQGIINSIMSGEIEGFSESDLISLEGKTIQDIERVFAPIIEGKTLNFERSKDIIRPKTKVLKSWEIDYAKEFSNTTDTLDAFRIAKKSIHKVEASKLRLNLEWWRIVFDEWKEKADTPYKLNIMTAYSMFEDTIKMGVLDAHTYYIDKGMAAHTDKKSYEALTMLYGFWEVIDRSPKFLEDIKIELTKISLLRSDQKRELRVRLSQSVWDNATTIIDEI